MVFNLWLFRKKYQPIHFPCESWLLSAGEELPREEAEAYFKWHVSCSKARAENLLKFASDDLGVNLDFSPEVLVSVWKTLKKGIKGIRVQPSVKGLDRKSLALGLHKPYLAPDKFSALLAIDLSHLFFWVFKTHYPQVEWSLGTKEDEAYNRLILTGFKATFIPERVSVNCILKGIRKADTPTILHDTYQNWEGHLK